MGLDLIVEGCAKRGHEEEWRRAVEAAFSGGDVTDAEVERFAEISIPPYQRLDAPRVGYDEAANAWIIEAANAKSAEEIATLLKDSHGYYALRLVECDGVPKYSHGGLYEGLDETSFRGAFLTDCGDVLEQRLIDEAWGHKLPDDAIAYGRALLAAAAAAPTEVAPRPPPKTGLLARLGLAKKPLERIPVDEQREIVEAAGRWFIFWGERGHPIRAWF